MKSDFSSPANPTVDGAFDDLLHSAEAFEHPHDVVHDPDLTVNEKRAILASWASDACAVEAVPALRRPPGIRQVVAVDEILDALRALDKLTQPETAWVRRQLRREALSEFRLNRRARLRVRPQAGRGPASCNVPLSASAHTRLAKGRSCYDSKLQ